MKPAREEILEKLKNAVHPEPEKPDFESPVYHSIRTPLQEAFKEALELVNGKVYLCNTKEDLQKSLQTVLGSVSAADIFCNENELKKLLSEAGIKFSDYSGIPENIQVGITGCEFLIAHTGSVMVSSAQAGGRQLFVYPPVHVVVAKKDQLVDYLESAYLEIQKKYGKNLPSQITLITGPSRTADIEKTLVMGAHGPRELHVFIH